MDKETALELIEKLNDDAFWKTCPNYSLQQWFLKGFDPGHFMGHLLSNNLLKAVQYADHGNRRIISDIVLWVFNNLPEACYGSRTKFENWKGLYKYAFPEPEEV